MLTMGTTEKRIRIEVVYHGFSRQEAQRSAGVPMKLVAENDTIRFAWRKPANVQ